MNASAQYEPGPAFGAHVQKAEDKWTLVLTRELRHSPEKVWLALSDPVHLREWAPFEADGNLDAVGSAVKITWAGNPKPIETKVTRAQRPHVLELGDIRWELKPLGSGTRLTLWHSIDRRFVCWGAAGWHISLDVLDRQLSGTPVERVAGGDAMKFKGWQRLVGEYAKLFGTEAPKFSPPAAPEQ